MAIEALNPELSILSIYLYGCFMAAAYEVGVNKRNYPFVPFILGGLLITWIIPFQDVVAWLYGLVRM